MPESGCQPAPNTGWACNRLLLPTAYHIVTTSQGRKVADNCWLPVAGMLFPKVPNMGWTNPPYDIPHCGTSMFCHSSATPRGVHLHTPNQEGVLQPSNRSTRYRSTRYIHSSMYISSSCRYTCTHTRAHAQPLHPAGAPDSAQQMDPQSTPTPKTTCTLLCTTLYTLYTARTCIRTATCSPIHSIPGCRLLSATSR